MGKIPPLKIAVLNIDGPLVANKNMKSYGLDKQNHVLSTYFRNTRIKVQTDYLSHEYTHLLFAQDFIYGPLVF